jgi:hypothetical protein
MMGATGREHVTPHNTGRCLGWPFPGSELPAVCTRRIACIQFAHEAWRASALLSVNGDRRRIADRQSRRLPSCQVELRVAR